jgi:hypothetical protein
MTMVLAFDTLGYAKRLRERGISQDQAEAHAEAARDFIMVELFTKTDAVNLKQELQVAMDNLGLRLTVRLGVLLAAGIGTLAALLKLA